VIHALFAAVATTGAVFSFPLAFQTGNRSISISVTGGYPAAAAPCAWPPLSTDS